MSRLRKAGRIDFETPCIECMQPVYMVKAGYAREFGHLYSTEGLKLYIRDGVCEMCSDILADFSVMNRRKDQV